MNIHTHKHKDTWYIYRYTYKNMNIHTYMHTNKHSTKLWGRTDEQQDDECLPFFYVSTFISIVYNLKMEHVY